MIFYYKYDDVNITVNCKYYKLLKIKEVLLLGIVLMVTVNDCVEHSDEPNAPELLDLDCASWGLSCG